MTLLASTKFATWASIADGTSTNFDFAPIAALTPDTALAIGIVLGVVACLGFAFGTAFGLGIK